MTAPTAPGAAMRVEEARTYEICVITENGRWRIVRPQYIEMLPENWNLYRDMVRATASDERIRKSVAW